ncbi:MAG: hypothetical protein IT495_22125 [Gammaproteobacteria bacterium]|nr:hypothetical protein [Gammaproteobacteria bacterium]
MDTTGLTMLARRAGLGDVSCTGSEADIVRAIQRARGEETCFRTERRLSCGRVHCEWRHDCRRLVAEWMR